MRRKFHPDFFQGRTVLITGAGSLGTQIAGLLLDCEVHAVRVLDNSEHSLFRLQQRFGGDSRLRYLLGDVTDYDRVEFAIAKVDYVVHTAANKFVDYIEYNPFQAISTNILGTMNVIKAVMKSPLVQKMVNISSDKACEPVSTYGMTKGICERLVFWASRVSEKVFASIRFPNFMPSEGSVFTVWEEQMARGEPLSITDERMRRWFIPLEEATELTLEVLEMSKGGELYVPETAREYKIADLAKKFGREVVFVGKRLGEKLEEKLMNDEERERAVLEGDLWVIREKFA